MVISLQEPGTKNWSISPGHWQPSRLITSFIPSFWRLVIITQKKNHRGETFVQTCCVNQPTDQRIWFFYQILHEGMTCWQFFSTIYKRSGKWDIFVFFFSVELRLLVWGLFLRMKGWKLLWAEYGNEVNITGRMTWKKNRSRAVSNKNILKKFSEEEEESFEETLR